MKFEDYKIGLRGHSVADNFDDTLKLTKENGVTNLQLAMTKTMKDIDFDKMGYDKAFADDVKKKLDAHNISISVLGCYINPVDENEEAREVQLTRFENFIKYAKHLDACVIGTEPGKNGDLEHTHSEEVYEIFLQSFRRLVKVAEENDVIIALEPVWTCTICTVEKLNKLLHDIDSDNLCVILDTSNIMRPENLDKQGEIIDYAFENFGHKIRAVHVKDFYFEDGVKKFAVTGTGNLDIKRIFDHMNKLPKMPEILLDELNVKDYPEARENLRKILG